jgi:hypothetical protein
LINSPIRLDDTNASAGFRYSKAKLKFRDFNGYFFGDVFDLVGFLHNINVDTKQGFIRILQIIDNVVSENKVYKYHIINTLKHVNDTKLIFEPIFREYDKHDRTFWKPIIYGHDYDTYLTDKFIYPIEKLFINKHINNYPKYIHKRTNPAYAYYQMKDINGIDDFKIYFPKAKGLNPKFKTNNNKWQNFYTMVNTWDVLLITKSYKDVISIKSFIDHIDTDLVIEVIAPPSENHILSKLEYAALSRNTREYLAKDIKAIISLYDKDYTGLTNSGYMKRKFNIHRFMFDSKLNGKDFTDNVIQYGKDFMFNLVVDVIHYIESIIY